MHYKTHSAIISKSEWSYSQRGHHWAPWNPFAKCCLSFQEQACRTKPLFPLPNAPPLPLDRARPLYLLEPDPNYEFKVDHQERKAHRWAWRDKSKNLYPCICQSSSSSDGSCCYTTLHAIRFKDCEENIDARFWKCFQTHRGNDGLIDSGCNRLVFSVLSSCMREAIGNYDKKETDTHRCPPS